MEEASFRLSSTQLVELLEQARAGSEQAKDEIFQHYLPDLLPMARRKIVGWLKSKIGGSDLAQETVKAAWEDFDSFRGHSDEELRDWLYAIMMHRLEDMKRRYRCRKRDVRREVALGARDADHGLADWLLAGALGPEEAAQEQEQEIAVLQALDRMPRRLADTLDLRVCHGLSFRKIGWRMGCSEEAARSLFRRAWRRLFEELGLTGPAPPPP